MSIDILMPALSPTMEEGTLAKWHVKVGDTVKSGDVIAEIETDKATMEVEAVDEGVIEDILVEAEGTEEVKVNAPIARLAGEGESAGSAAQGRSRAAEGAQGRRRLRPPAPTAPLRLPRRPSPPTGEPHLRLAAWPAAGWPQKGWT
jgi:pyruvate dehydrogenase E2 component (dihydrolipoamide acetyltransferase)